METLPPMTGTGVILKFVFPFDRALPRTARVLWQQRIGGIETEYAQISQGGAAVAHEQVTFPGDAWVVRGVETGELLARHVATQEREQRVVVDGIATASTAAAASGADAAMAEASSSTAAGGLEEPEMDAELEAAVRASLATAASEATSSSAVAHYQSASEAHDLVHAADADDAAATLRESVRRDEQSRKKERLIREACTLSKRLADQYRAKAAREARPAAEPQASPEVLDADALRAARLRRFGGS